MNNRKELTWADVFEEVAEATNEQRQYEREQTAAERAQVIADIVRGTYKQAA